MAFAASAHLALIWGLWQVGMVPQVAAQLRPLMVSLLSVAAPVPPAPTTGRRVVQPAALPPPVMPSETAPASTWVVPVAAPPTPAVVEAVPTAFVAPAPAPAPVTVPRRQVAASAVQYLLLPPAETPRASRRAGESGTVWLRVVVDVNGAPAVVTLQRSSGHARLDEQALWAMRKARFKPYSEDGRLLEVEVIAPVEYPAD